MKEHGSSFSKEIWPLFERRDLLLISGRLVLTILLLSATIYKQAATPDPSQAFAFTALYAIAVGAFISLILYVFSSARSWNNTLNRYLQIGIDSFLVSSFIFITGGYESLFTFLYLVLVIYAATTLFLLGGLFTAGISSLQYAALVFLDYQGIPASMGFPGELAVMNQPWSQVLARICITATACVAVAVLSGLLTEQNRRTQKELKAVENHLKRVEKMAYMGEMAAGLAHEIKNPLASLTGSIQLLKDELRLTIDHQRLMDIILRETDRLATLVNDFLFFARPPAGKPRKLNVKDAIEEITALFEKDQAHAREVVIEKQLQPDLWLLMDPTHLRQVMWNLLLNAAEAVAEGGRIIIRAVRDKKQTGFIQIEDNGCGIADEVVQSIFNPFFTTKTEGTGLGLSIVHRILEAYDCRLEVDSQPGRGAVFTFSFKSVKPPV